MEHLTSVDQLDTNILDIIFRAADRCRGMRFKSYPLSHPGRVVANLFYEPSTRTAASFHVAALRLGASVFTVDDVKFSSMAKGETLEDTIRVIGSYVDAIVLRHPDDDAAERAAQVSSVPVINAGCGTREHPTQAILDMYTIQREYGTTPPPTVGLMGDLRNGRTVHSLVKLLRLYDAKIRYISPGELQMPISLKRGGEISFSDLGAILDRLDVLYMTRMQRERMHAGLLDGCNYGLTPMMLKQHGKPNLVIMHPLPRCEELPVEIDWDPRAAYFRQAENGLYVRMALLSRALS